MGRGAGVRGGIRLRGWRGGRWRDGGIGDRTHVFTRPLLLFESGLDFECVIVLDTVDGIAIGFYALIIGYVDGVAG